MIEYEGNKQVASCGHSPCGRWQVYEILDGQFENCLEIIDTKEEIHVIVDNENQKGFAILADIVSSEERRELIQQLSGNSNVIKIELTPEEIEELVRKKGNKAADVPDHEDLPADKQDMFRFVMGGRGEAEG
jgi:hypothetical protein